MASRLDKLYELLESNNGSVRAAAACQLGQISLNCQNQLSSLLIKLLPYVKHKTWSVRIAASEAVRQMGQNGKVWVPMGDSGASVVHWDSQLISLERLDLYEVLKVGKRLYSTDVSELEGGLIDPLVNREEINKHLGLTLPGRKVEEEEDSGLLIGVEDLCEYKKSDDGEDSDIIKVSVDKVVENCLRVDNARKRGHKKEIEVEEPVCKVKKEIIDDNIWPWSDFCSDLLVSLWHPKWEVRHGAATALREMTRSQGAVMVDKSASNVCRTEFEKCHTLFLEDVVGRILCTLALDQLSDFVNDEMVAPVRESCAQCLGLLTVHLPESTVKLIVTRHLLVLLSHNEWTVTHGALLGLKYVLASRQDILHLLLPLVYEPISTHLRDSRDDDVRCAAASALMPIFSRSSLDCLPQKNQLDSLKNDLWTVLSLRTDYTSPGAAGAILSLLQTLYEVEDGRNVLPSQTDMAVSINRLHWCYFNYGESVRISAVLTCGSIMRYYGLCLEELAPHILLQVLTQLYQRILLDDSEQVRVEAESLWRSIVNKVSAEKLALCCLEKLDSWICCAMQPGRLCYSQDFLVLPLVDDNNDDSDSKLHQLPMEFFIGGRESHLIEGSSSVRGAAVLSARLSACRSLAQLCSRLSSLPSLDEHILLAVITNGHLKERLALQRFVAASILCHWGEEQQVEPVLVAPLCRQLTACLEEPIYYQELLPHYRHMLRSCHQLISLYSQLNIALPPPVATESTGAMATLNIAQCQSLVSPQLLQRLTDSGTLEDTSSKAFSSAKMSVELCSSEHSQWSRLVEVSVASALLAWRQLPKRLTPLIRPLMEAVRAEPRLLLQTEAATALSRLLVLLISPEITAPLTKLLRNLVTYLSESVDRVWSPGDLQGVLLLHKVAQLGRECTPLQEQLPLSPGSTTASSNSSSSTDGGTAECQEQEEQLAAAVVKLRGSRMALEGICRLLCLYPGSVAAPIVLQVVFQQSQAALQAAHSDRGCLLAALRVAVTVLPVMKRRLSLFPSIDILSYCLCVHDYGLCHLDMTVRHWSARLLASVALPLEEVTLGTDTEELALSRSIVDTVVLGRLLPCLDLDSSSGDLACQGAVELLYLLMHHGLGSPLPYRLSLVVPLLPTVLRALNSHNESVRQTATLLFALLLTLLPLELHGANNAILTPERQQQRQSSRAFIDGLLRPDSIGDFDVSHIVRQPLRHYQQLGVNWLSFLHKYGLHGVLADDMGLGKTLQTLSVIAAHSDSDTGSVHQPSLVVCPATLTSHWLSEVLKHIVPPFSALLYVGPSEQRLALSRTFSSHHLVITSYDILRNDIERLQRPSTASAGTSTWKYLVLDEGHLIRNYKSKLSQAAKQVVARHRLLLTGTPVQNRVAELWSLFDFLMPGLLGSHSEFQRQYGRLLSQAAVSGYSVAAGAGAGGGTSRKVEREEGTVALGSLHRQVLPFMLRRLKEDVLQELPPKIMQDYLCHMSPLQQRLHSLFLSSAQGSSLSLDLDSEAGTDRGPEQRHHVFQALHYLRQVCNHPCLALCPSHPLYSSVTKELASKGLSLEDLSLSGKLTALKQLILDCGIATDTAVSPSLCPDSAEDTAVVSGHRLLLFCQSRSMVALVQAMLSRELPRASFLTLDGSVPVRDRHAVIDTFNSDPSVDMLLLTTAVGGLGLNLTSADTVVFVEHDWNPMKDLQAMDRAHRIGQRRSVNVYRLITADSIEERIMSLQHFKTYVANELVSGDNKQLASMNTASILDIMNSSGGAAAPKQDPGANGGRQPGLKGLLSGMQGVYDTAEEYEQEYSLENYVKML